MLLAGALRQDLPYADSVRMAKRFWGAGPRGRLLNAPGLGRDLAFSASALRAAEVWPASVDARLSVGPFVPADVRERLRRSAAYLLAPRRVVLVAGAGSEVSLAPVPAGSPAR